MNVAVLGGSGMLGSMTVDWLCRDRSLTVIATVRTPKLLQEFRDRCRAAEWRLFDVKHLKLADLLDVIRGSEWVINCIGIIKPYIHDDNAVETEHAILTNALFPHLLASAADQAGCHVLQIATDCVFSGQKGQYLEHDKHDALDVYGKTKSLGEVFSDKVHHLRVSIIGPEPLRHASLLDWFLHQPRGSSVSGYTNHRWNGITTMHFARLCHGLMTHQSRLAHLHHVVPAGAITKAELLHCIAENYRRDDIRITPTEAPTGADRTLATADPTLNRELWAVAGHPQPPSVAQMVAELTQFDYRFRREPCVQPSH
jgi:dTDP-4-dehydrorhamnose reductase